MVVCRRHGSDTPAGGRPLPAALPPPSPKGKALGTAVGGSEEGIVKSEELWCDAERHGLDRLSLSQAASGLTIACGQSGRGSDSPPDCHSLPRRRFAYPRQREPSFLLRLRRFRYCLRQAGDFTIAPTGAVRTRRHDRGIVSYAVRCTLRDSAGDFLCCERQRKHKV